MSKAITLLIILHLSCVLASLIPVSSAEPEDDSVTVRLAVHVFDIDQSRKIAEVKTYIYIDDFPDNRTEVWVRIIGGGSLWIPCKNYGPIRVDTWRYQGESNQTAWLLEGTSEIFPFDSYNLRFKILEMPIVEGNFSLSSSKELQAFFDGPKAYSLKDLWRVDSGLIPIANLRQNEVSFLIQRSSDSLIVAFIEFLVPIIGCFYLLGATLLLDPKRQLAERLRIHLSLFVFATTFFMGIQGFLPYRSSLSFPEFLLTNLTISNTIFGILSVIGSQKIPSKRGRPSKRSKLGKWDSTAATLSLLVLSGLFVFFLFGKMTVTASIVLTYVVIPSYIYPLFLVTPKEQLWRQRRLVISFIILFFIPAFILFLLQLLLLGY